MKSYRSSHRIASEVSLTPARVVELMKTLDIEPELELDGVKYYDLSDIVTFKSELSLERFNRRVQAKLDDPQSGITTWDAGHAAVWSELYQQQKKSETTYKEFEQAISDLPEQDQEVLGHLWTLKHFCGEITFSEKTQQKLDSFDKVRYLELIARFSLEDRSQATNVMFFTDNQ